MPAVPVTLNGVIYPKAKHGASKPEAVVFVGSAWLTGRRPDISPPGDQPHPEHPIFLPPGWENPVPPDPPIDVTPPDPTPPGGTPNEDGFVKPPPANGGWAFHEDNGWGYFPASGAGPKK